MQKRQSQQSQSGGIKPWHILVILLILVGCAIYSVQVMMKGYVVDPPKVFSEYFTNSLTRVHDLKGGGTISSVFDMWLTFQCNDVIRFAKPKLFLPQKDDRAWHYLTDHYPEEKDLVQLNDLDTWTMLDHPDPVRVVNAWLVGNKKTNRYWFRAWGRL